MSEKRKHQKAFLVSRRRMLQLLGIGTLAPLASNALEMIINTAVGGVISDAQAAESGEETPKFLEFWLGGGAHQWNYYPIHVNSSDPFQANPGVITSFRGGTYGYFADPVTVGSRTYMMPPIWAQNLVRPNGSSVPAKALLEGGCLMMNFSTSQDHERATYSFRQPDSSEMSSVAMAIDSHSEPIAGLKLPGGHDIFGIAPNTGYLQANTERVTPSGNQPSLIQSIFNDFKITYQNPTDPNSYFARRRALESMMNIAMAKLSAHVQSRNPGAAYLESNRGRAEAMLKRTFEKFLSGSGSVQTEFDVIYNKYANLIRSAMARVNTIHPNPFPTDKAFGLTGHRFQVTPGPNNPYYRQTATNADLRTLINSTNANVADRTFISQMALNYAVSEYMFKEGLSSHILAGGGWPTNLQLSGADLIDEAGNVMGSQGASRVGHGWDAHATGKAVDCIATSMYWYSMNCCLYEFIQSMTSVNLWSNMVVAFGTEFGRVSRGVTRALGQNEAENFERNGGTGTDHTTTGFVSYFSPQISAFQDCIHARTNIYNTSTYAGTAGNHAGIPYYNGSGSTGSAIGPRGVNATLATLLRIKDYSNAEPSILGPDGKLLVERSRTKA